jgi:hypothetical protein
LAADGTIQRAEIASDARTKGRRIVALKAGSEPRWSEVCR